MKLYLTHSGVVVEKDSRFFHIPIPKSDSLEGYWDRLMGREDIAGHVRSELANANEIKALPPLLPPAVSQEVWAAGVTYWRSRVARMEESKSAGGGDFYDRVYSAERPELFFKAAGHRVVGSGQ